MARRDALLLELRSAIDKVEGSFRCITGCIKCCEPIDMTYVELVRLTPEQQLRFATERGARCCFAVEGLGCEIYEERPIVCRMFGYMVHGLCFEGLSTHAFGDADEEQIFTVYGQIIGFKSDIGSVVRDLSILRSLHR